MTLSSGTTTTGDILIVDDTLDNLRFLSDLLTEAGYTVRKVTNGDMGLEAARLEPPDLILLDIQMPGLTGYEVCEQLKKGDRTQHIPVIFLSARDEELDKVIAFEIGGVDYITKPFQVVEVLARIKTHLSVNRLQQTLRLQNDRLSEEIAQRIAAEEALRTLNQELETLNQKLESQVGDTSAPQPGSRSRPQRLQAAPPPQASPVNEPPSQQLTALIHNFQTSLAELVMITDALQRRRANFGQQEQRYISRMAEHINHMSQVLRDSTNDIP